MHLTQLIPAFFLLRSAHSVRSKLIQPEFRPNPKCARHHVFRRSAPGDGASLPELARVLFLGQMLGASLSFLAAQEPAFTDGNFSNQRPPATFNVRRFLVSREASFTFSKRIPRTG